jgi:hypothetical protein
LHEDLGEVWAEGEEVSKAWQSFSKCFGEERDLQEADPQVLQGLAVQVSGNKAGVP